MEYVADTIASIATPPGIGGIGIVRVSGPLAYHIGCQVTGKTLKPRQAYYGEMRDQHARLIDKGICLFFKAPHSFTGEDVLELQAHGGPILIDTLLRCTIEQGARQSQPGEFSFRAFMNDKLDLLEAEAVADLISSQSQHAYQSALRSLSGEFSYHIHQIVQNLIELRVYVEAALDFPEEEVDFLKDQQLIDKMDSVLEDLKSTLNSAEEGKVLREGLQLVILGKPNAGKSSLLNALSETEAAIVTDIPGTTRDTVEQSILVEGLPVHIVDTAGIRETEDKIEKMGIQKAHDQAAKAQHIFLIIDSNEDEDSALYEQYQDRTDMTVIRNKIDLSKEAPGKAHLGQHTTIGVSIKTRQGLDTVKQHLRQIAGLSSNENSAFSARTRHIQALQQALKLVENSYFLLNQSLSGELIAEDLREAQHALNTITGEFTNDDLLGEIFGSFCIGK